MSRRISFTILAAGIFLISLAASYYGNIVFKYPAPPGDDIYVHLANTAVLSAQGIWAPVGYPRGMYVAVLEASRALGVNPLQTYVWMAPALLPLSGLAVFYLAKQLLSRSGALLAYALYALVSLQPLQTYFDGGLPNLLAAGIFLPLLWSSIIKYYWDRSARDLIAAVFLGLLIAWFHHLTLLIMLGTLVPWAALMLAVLLFGRWRWRGLLAAAAGTLFIAGSVAATLFHLPLLFPARGLIELFFRFGGGFPFVHPIRSNDGAPWNATLFGTDLGGLIFQSSVVGFLIAIWRKLKPDSYGGWLLLLCWYALYLGGSLTPLSGYPTRLARDLAMPASILAAAAISWGYAWLLRRASPLHVAYAVAIVAASAQPALLRLDTLTSYSQMIRFSPADQQAYEYLLSSGLARSTAIVSSGLDWPAVIDIRGDQHRLRVILPSAQAATAFECYAIEQPLDESGGYAAPNLATGAARLKEVRRFSDPSKSVDIFCRS